MIAFPMRHRRRKPSFAQITVSMLDLSGKGTRRTYRPSVSSARLVVPKTDLERIGDDFRIATKKVDSKRLTRG